EVTVSRLAYRRRGRANLHPADAALNLPEERHSHGLRRLAAEAASRGSFDDATEAIRKATATEVGKRQVEQLAQRAAKDVEDFYASRAAPAGDAGDILVLSADGKGIVMRPDALRPATAAAAAASSTKLQTRLSKGEKRNRKRMAEVGAVYDATPVVRTTADVLGSGEEQRTPAPSATNKWLTASVVEDAAEVLSDVFDEAERRDPTHARTWVALVDGNNHQIDRIQAEAKARSVTVSILMDFIHVLEYLWRAAWSFYAEGDPDAETWVKDKALAILDGQAPTVAAAIRRKATCLGLETAQRANADRCADYLLNKRGYLDYPMALEKGWPIATGVIEG
ncbi:MAG: ISKra4 family transposase, partial [Gemmatimonadales bacterium]